MIIRSDAHLLQKVTNDHESHQKRMAEKGRVNRDEPKPGYKRKTWEPPKSWGIPQERYELASDWGYPAECLYFPDPGVWVRRLLVPCCGFD